MIRISSRDSARPSAIPSPHSTTVTASSSDVSRSRSSSSSMPAQPVGVDVHQRRPVRERRVLAGDHERGRGDVAADAEPGARCPG